MKVRVLIEMDDGASGIRAVNVLDSAMREYNEKLTLAVPDAAIDFEVLGIVRESEVRAGVVAEEPEWGIANAKTPDKVWPLSEEGARATAAAEPGQWIIYSRPKTVVHEWVPVKQEGASPSGLPVAGLLHAGGDSHTEREDADQPETDAEPVPERLIHPPGDYEHEQEQGTDEQVPVELHTDDSTPAGRHTGMKQEGAAANG